MNYLNQLKMKSILVVGDVMLDTYVNGNVSRISPEAPVPVFLKKSERFVLGGAANVASNLVAANQKVSIITVVGDDKEGEKILDCIKEKHINTDLVLRIHKQTTVKTRFLASNNQQVMRLDKEDTTPLSRENEEVLLQRLENSISQFDLVLISDYMKGLLTYDFTQKIIKMSKEYGKRVVIDVKDADIEKYKGAYLLKPNLDELHILTNMPTTDDSEIIAAAQVLRNKGNCEYVLVTCGARGMVLVGKDEPYFIGSVGKEVFDVTGAGDTTVAYLSSCLANEMDIREAVEISNYAAGLQVAKVGTSSITWWEVYNSLADRSRGFLYKLLDSDAVEEFRSVNNGKKIVFTNGCFDIMHVGHIRYLKKAAALGDILVVGLNSDKSVNRLKGADRPINSESDRAELLCSLGFVDYVAIFKEDTPYNLIQLIQPDVLVKGGDYEREQVIGKEIVEARGGRVELIPFVKGKSTTNMIKKINGYYMEGDQDGK